MKSALLSLVFAGVVSAQLVADVRRIASAGDYAAAEKAIDAVRGKSGWTPEALLAYSWLGRTAQAAKQWPKAESYASETRRIALEMLKGRQLDAEPDLPLALGASIEVRAHTLANTGRLSEATSFLSDELKRWHDTSMRSRIQKNLHLLTLEGKQAPALEAKRFLGTKKFGSLADFRGKPVLLFLWAHWCGDCKYQGAIVEEMRKEFPRLEVIAPTQRYGYVANGEDAPPEKETPYIATVQKQQYPWMTGLAIPVSEENFRAYGVSSTPTLVLIDPAGTVRMYHPGKMAADELRQALTKVSK